MKFLVVTPPSIYQYQSSFSPFSWYPLVGYIWFRSLYLRLFCPPLCGVSTSTFYLIYNTIIPPHWTSTCPSRRPWRPSYTSRLLWTTPLPLQIPEAVWTWLSDPLPLTWTFPQTWTKLVHQIHYISQALHCLSGVDASITTASAPITSDWPAMNAYTLFILVASDNGTAATDPPMNQNQCSKISSTISVQPFPLSLLMFPMNPTQFTPN